MVGPAGVSQVEEEKGGADGAFAMCSMAVSPSFTPSLPVWSAIGGSIFVAGKGDSV